LPETDLTLLTEAAYAAGEIATAFVGGELRVEHKPDDLGPVTDADKAVNRALETRLRRARPDYGWLSEESPDDSARLRAARTFVIDPIDGTRAFIEGQTTWSHVLAVVSGNRVEAAVVYLPMLDKLYAAAAGQGARLNGVPLAVSRQAEPTGATLLATRNSLDARFWRGGVPDVKRSHRPSLAYRQCLVAEGRFDAMLTFRPTWEWDVAAGALILAEAGARVSDRRGGALRFNAPHPQVDGLVAANPALHAAVLDHLS
jgi:myo-inositol-1(or 4)-monophosphatase